MKKKRKIKKFFVLFCFLFCFCFVFCFVFVLFLFCFSHFFTQKNTCFPHNFVFYYHPKNKLAKILEVLPHHPFYSSFSMKDSQAQIPHFPDFLKQQNTKKKKNKRDRNEK